MYMLKQCKVCFADAPRLSETSTVCHRFPAKGRPQWDTCASVPISRFSGDQSWLMYVWEL